MEGPGYSFGQYLYEKKKKRDQITGSVVTPGTPVALTGTHYTTGPFIAETIWICNYCTVAVTISILDGTEYKVRAQSSINGVTLAAGAWIWISPIYMPFFTAVNFDASSDMVICTMGGWIP